MLNHPDHKAAALAIESFLKALGHDPLTSQLQGTSQRVASLFIDEWLNGYHIDINKLFEETMAAPLSASTIFVGPLSTHMICPHHLTLAAGSVTIAYQPQNQIVGFGTLAQLVDAYAHRLTLQEEVGSQIVNTLVDKLKVLGAACLLRFHHPCLEHHAAANCERKLGSLVQSITYAGVFSEHGAARTEVTNMLLKQEI